MQPTLLVFATSDKGGTGRSVTSSNILYRMALQGKNVAYLDFDFGSPTAGSVFNINKAMRGTREGGLHQYLRGEIPEPKRLEVWDESDRPSLRGRPDGAGKFVLYPGDEGGGEFIGDVSRAGQESAPDPESQKVVRRCVELFLRLNGEFDLILVDLSAGRSHATEIVLEATSPRRVEEAARTKGRNKPPHLAGMDAKWLVFHRWTRQHVIAAAGLAYGDNGIVRAGMERGHDEKTLKRAIRFVRTAVVDPRSQELAGLRAAQVGWLHEVDRELHELAGKERVGRTVQLGSVPLDPVLQWREQLISDTDTITRRIANPATVDAFVTLAKRLNEDWAEL